MAKHRTHRTHSIAFKRQVVEEYLAGQTLHDPSRTLIRIRVDKYKAAAFDEGSEAADTLQGYEARIAALELEFLEGAQRQGWQPRGAPMSVITGPKASPSPKDAD